MIKPSSPSAPPSPSTSCRNNFPATSFLDHCFLCKQKLLPGKDIYMYKGDKAFCSVECRCRQMFMDEEETFKTKNKRENCSLAAMKPPPTSSSSSSPSPSPSPSRSRRGARKGGNGFAC
ncbi:unnamed protein product [Ilex paraguariensis]|uniref:FLZ-type domain-containing protein n=1 Tax=Ilex paraguariensis TaxID=185542 RepID=A0ABC8TGB2_9AQUA